MKQDFHLESGIFRVYIFLHSLTNYCKSLWNSIHFPTFIQIGKIVVDPEGE